MKEWTFLLYANGHNELEPEIWQSVSDIQNNFKGDINIAVQVSREEQDIVRLLRPNMDFAHAKDDWSGVRRYVFFHSGGTFHKLKSINMADPKSLYDFIIWGIESCPAQRYMLSISGHIYQFVGICPDYSQNKPYILGFPEISASIKNACDKLGADIDIFILDTCYAGTVEILYEFGRYTKPPIKNILTYIGKGPLGGLCYSNVLSVLADNANTATYEILKAMVRHIDLQRHYGLIAFRLEPEVLQIIKELFNKLASTYLSCKWLYEDEFSPEELLSSYGSSYPWSLFLKPIHDLLKLLVVDVRLGDSSKGGVLPIHILYQKIPDERRKKLYSRLSFARQNAWLSLLCGIPPKNAPGGADNNDNADGFSHGLEPLAISENILTAFICAANEHLTPGEQTKLVGKLAKSKHWDLD